MSSGISRACSIRGCGSADSRAAAGSRQWLRSVSRCAAAGRGSAQPLGGSGTSRAAHRLERHHSWERTARPPCGPCASSPSRRTRHPPAPLRVSRIPSDRVGAVRRAKTPVVPQGGRAVRAPRLAALASCPRIAGQESIGGCGSSIYDQSAGTTCAVSCWRSRASRAARPGRTPSPSPEMNCRSQPRDAVLQRRATAERATRGACGGGASLVPCLAQDLARGLRRDGTIEPLVEGGKIAAIRNLAALGPGQTNAAP